MNMRKVQGAEGLGIVPCARTLGTMPRHCALCTRVARLWIVTALAAVSACSTGAGAVSCSMPVPQTQAGTPGSHDRIPIGQLPDIDADAVLAHTKTLSSDEFAGRAPGTKGEELTVAYLFDQFKKLGLKPGNTD